MGIIFIGIFKEVKKSKKEEKTQGKRPAANLPPIPKTRPDYRRMPEAWNMPQAVNDESVVMESMQRRNRKKKQVAAVSPSVTQASNEKEMRVTTQSPLPFTVTSDSNDCEEEYAIRSAEEARRAIIWGEILQRKY